MTYDEGALLRYAPPYAVGERIWLVIGTKDGEERAIDQLDWRTGEKVMHRWREPGHSYRGHFKDPAEAEAKAAQLLGDGWQVTMIVPP